SVCRLSCFFFQAEDGIRDRNVTGVQTCALPILSLREVCDADVYLLRAAGFHGVPTETACPVCRKENLAEVSWIFGDDLGSASGSARGADEIHQLALAHDAFTVHVVEVCRSCSWNFLVESYEVGLPEGTGRRTRRAARALRHRG